MTIKSRHFTLAKNPQKAPFESQCLENIPGAQVLLENICEVLGADKSIAVDLLFAPASGDSDRYHGVAFEAVVGGFLRASHQYIPGFTELKETGHWHTRITLAKVFADGSLNEQILDNLSLSPFEPHTVPRYLEGYVRSLLVNAGVRDERHIGRCLDAILVQRKARKSQDDPRKHKAATVFCQAFAQDHLPLKISVSAAIERLGRFGVNRAFYYRVYKRQFMPRSLRSESSTRTLIAHMSKAIGIDPVLATQLLLEGGQ
jgi:hypothetical protein